jgi:hypothetical protein
MSNMMKEMSMIGGAGFGGDIAQQQMAMMGRSSNLQNVQQQNIAQMQAQVLA